MMINLPIFTVSFGWLRLKIPRSSYPRLPLMARRALKK